METTGIHQGMGIIDSDLMDIFAINLNSQVSAVVCSERTKYCPMLSVRDLLVTFHRRWIYKAVNIKDWTDLSEQM